MRKNGELRSVIRVFAVVLTIGVCAGANSRVFAQKYFDKEGDTPQKEQRSTAYQKLPYFDKDVSYDVYYEVSAYETNRVQNISIIDTVGINGVPFLVIRYSGQSSRIGYIRLASIKAILPTQVEKPKRTQDLLRQY